MKTSFFLFLFVIILSTSSWSQSIDRQAVTTAGKTSTTSTFSLSWTLGEMAIQTYVGANLQLTEGFHQGYLMLVPTLNRVDHFGDIKVFPNPISQLLFVERKAVITPLFMELVDAQGRSLWQHTLVDRKDIFDFSHLPQGMYFLHLSDETRGQRTMKIQKF